MKRKALTRALQAAFRRTAGTPSPIGIPYRLPPAGGGAAAATPAGAGPPVPDDRERDLIDRERQLRVLMSSWI